MWHFYVRCYYFDKKEFKVRIGFFVKKYHYHDIKKSYITENNRISYATSKKRIAISLKKELDSDVTGVDISDDALSLSNENAKLNNVDVKFIKSDIYSNVSGKFDIIISNPPYIASDEVIMDKVFDYEPHLALFAEDNGLYFYKKILDDAKDYLNDKFIIAFEIGMTQGEEISNYAKSIFNNVNVIVEKDLSLKDRFVFIISE